MGCLCRLDVYPNLAEDCRLVESFSRHLIGFFLTTDGTVLRSTSYAGQAPDEHRYDLVFFAPDLCSSVSICGYHFFFISFYIGEARRGYEAQRNIRCLRRLDLWREGVEVFWSKVRTVRPRKCVTFERKSLEILWILQWLENRPIQFIFEIDLAICSIAEL